MYAQLVFALDRAAQLGHPTSLDELHAGGMPALMALLKLTHAGITTDEFTASCRSWLALARHPRFGRPYTALVYQPMLELLGLLDRSGFSDHTDGDREYAYDHDPILGSGTDGIRAAATDQKWTVIDRAADWSAVYPPAV